MMRKKKTTASEAAKKGWPVRKKTLRRDKKGRFIS